MVSWRWLELLPMDQALVVDIAGDIGQLRQLPSMVDAVGSMVVRSRR